MPSDDEDDDDADDDDFVAAAAAQTSDDGPSAPSSARRRPADDDDHASGRFVGQRPADAPQPVVDTRPRSALDAVLDDDDDLFAGLDDRGLASTPPVDDQAIDDIFNDRLFFDDGPSHDDTGGGGSAGAPS